MYSKPFVLVALVNFLTFGILNAYNLLPLYIQALGGREAEIGRIMAVYHAAAILWQAGTAALLDRWPRKPVLLAATAALAIVALGFASTTQLGWHFYAFRFLQGAALAMITTVSLLLIAELAPPGRRAEAVGIFGVSGLSAIAIAPAAGEQLIRAFGFPVFFLATAAVGVAALLLCAAIPVPAAVQAPDAPAPAAFRWLTLLPVLVPAFAFGLANTILFVFLPPFGRLIGLPRVGPFYLVYTVAAIVVRFAGGRLADRVGHRRIILPALIGQTAGLFLCAALQETGLLLVVGLLNGTGQGFVFPAASAMAFELAPGGRRGRTMAMFNIAVLVGGVLGATGFGWLAEAVGYRSGFAIAGLVLSLGAVAFWWTSRQSAPKRGTGPAPRHGLLPPADGGEPGTGRWA